MTCPVHHDNCPAILGQWGPFTVHRMAYDDKMGWVLSIHDGSGESVQVRTTPKGRGMTVDHTLWKEKP